MVVRVSDPASYHITGPWSNGKTPDLQSGNESSILSGSNQSSNEKPRPVRVGRGLGGSPGLCCPAGKRYQVAGAEAMGPTIHSGGVGISMPVGFQRCRQNLWQLTYLLLGG